MTSALPLADSPVRFRKDQEAGCTRRLRWAGRLLLACLASCASSADLGLDENWPAPRAGAVVSEHPLATRVGLRILQSGGNAADAAVGTALALAVVYPRAGNLGGGGFALFVPHDRGDDDDELRALDFRETAPRGLTPSHFLVDGKVDRGLALASRLSAGVPGTPDGLHRFHAKFGRLPFSQVIAPAIELAESGFELNAWDARALVEAKQKLGGNAASRELFFGSDGEPLGEGDRLRQPTLASTLRSYSRFGPSGFYEGAVARALVEEMDPLRGGAQPEGRAQGARGVIDGVDLLDYESKWREPLRGWFGGMEVITMPAPSSGGIVLLEVLAVLDGFPLAVERRAGPRGWQPTARALHWWIEAMRAAFAERAEHLGDPDFHDVPVAELLSSEWIHSRRVGIGERANAAIEPWKLGSGGFGGDETTHVSVLDSSGNAVSLTTTLNSSFGSGILVEGAGFLLNNEMDDFSILAGVPNVYGLVGSSANQLASGRRPLSSMTPTVVRDGGNSVALVLGSPGGPKIITAVLQVLLRVLAYEQPLGAAVRAPRLHQQWTPSGTTVEPGWDEELLEELRRRGHAIELAPGVMGSVQAIHVPQPGGLPAVVSDPRRGGVGGVQGRSVGFPSRVPKSDESVLIGTPQ